MLYIISQTSLVRYIMLPAKMADRIMLPDKVTEMENSIQMVTGQRAA